MKTIPLSRSLPDPRRALGWAVLAAIAVMLVTGTARADPRHDHRGPPPRHIVARDWHRHEVRNEHYWHGRRPEPGVVYAPPVVYQTPPPVESPGLNLIVPLNFH